MLSMKPDRETISIAKYRDGRFWAVWIADELLAVVVYKKGAEAIQRRLMKLEVKGAAGALEKDFRALNPAPRQPDEITSE